MYIERAPCLSPVAGRNRPALSSATRSSSVYTSLSKDGHVAAYAVVGMGVAARRAWLAQHLSDLVGGVILGIVIAAVQRLDGVDVLEDAVLGCFFKGFGLGAVGPEQAAPVVEEATEGMHGDHEPANFGNHFPELGDLVHAANVVVQAERSNVSLHPCPLPGRATQQCPELPRTP